MKEAMEKLWNEYFSDICAAVDTEEERVLLKKSIEAHQAINELLTEEQCKFLEKYVEAIYETQSLFIKKAFFKGCEFAMSFLFEAKAFGKENK